jgi:cobalt-zinc-cadmium efflux system outer membrane protein
MRRALRCAITVITLCGVARPVAAQLTLAAARQAAQRTSPAVRAAQEGVLAAAARERQAGAFPNPILAYSREQTSRAGQTNAQDIAQVEQPLELGGQRSARREAARLRHASAAARLDAARLQVDADVTRAFVLAVAAERRARLANQATASFVEAQRVSDQRLAAGDVAGYAARRLRLEAARFAAVRAAALLERQSTRTALASLMGTSLRATDSLDATLDAAALVSVAVDAPLDSLIARAERERPERKAATLDAAALEADARLAARERIPTPVIAAGYKGERVADPAVGSLTGFQGFIAGVSVPLPLFDRRRGAVSAAEAEGRRARTEGDAVRRRIAREVTDAADAFQSAELQVALLAPHLGEDAQITVRAVQASYAEGEITLVEWLDAMRAYQEAESTYVTLQADVALRRAALARALGTPRFPSVSPDR